MLVPFFPLPRVGASPSFVHWQRRYSFVERRCQFFLRRLAVPLAFPALSECRSHSRACRGNVALFCLYLLCTLLHLISTAMLSPDLSTLLSCHLAPLPPPPSPLTVFKFTAFLLPPNYRTPTLQTALQHHSVNPSHRRIIGTQNDHAIANMLLARPFTPSPGECCMPPPNISRAGIAR